MSTLNTFIAIGIAALLTFAGYFVGYERRQGEILVLEKRTTDLSRKLEEDSTLFQNSINH